MFHFGAEAEKDGGLEAHAQLLTKCSLAASACRRLATTTSSSNSTGIHCIVHNLYSFLQMLTDVCVMLRARGDSHVLRDDIITVSSKLKRKRRSYRRTVARSQIHKICFACARLVGTRSRVHHRLGSVTSYPAVSTQDYLTAPPDYSRCQACRTSEADHPCSCAPSKPQAS